QLLLVYTRRMSAWAPRTNNTIASRTALAGRGRVQGCSVAHAVLVLARHAGLKRAARKGGLSSASGRDRRAKGSHSARSTLPQLRLQRRHVSEPQGHLEIP